MLDMYREVLITARGRDETRCWTCTARCGSWLGVDVRQRFIEALLSLQPVRLLLAFALRDKRRSSWIVLSLSALYSPQANVCVLLAQRQDYGQSKMNVIMIHRFYIALCSALEQTHCAHVACDSE